MTIDNGNVGIGMISPTHKLEVAGASMAPEPVVSIQQTGNGRGLRVNTIGGACAYVAEAGNHGLRVSSAGGDGIHVDQATGRAGYFNGNVEITGNVGIGASSGASKLHVEGTGWTPAINVVNEGVGIQITTAMENGIRINSGCCAVLVENTPMNGLFVMNADQDGVLISNAGHNGIHVEQAAGLAGYFGGDVEITGNLTVNGIKSFKIDHPLDPANKYLYHYCIESDEPGNVYNGNAVLDDAGTAVVSLPDWFETLNRDFRYQLTPIGAPGPDLHIAREISGNRFTIGGGTPGMKVSWQVTGVRHDPAAEAQGAPVEVEKTVNERGKYMNPAVYGLPREMGVHHRADDDHHGRHGGHDHHAEHHE